MAEKNYITPAGWKRIVDELVELATVERPRVVREVSDAAAEGDRSENAAYIYGKRRLREIDRRMGFLHRRLKNIEVVSSDERRKDRVFFGAWVDVEDGESGETHCFQIVGVDEVDAGRGRISWQSPVGRALLGKREGDEVAVVLPNGRRALTVEGIRYDAPVTIAAPPPLPADLSEEEPVAAPVRRPAKRRAPGQGKNKK